MREYQVGVHNQEGDLISPEGLPPPQDQTLLSYARHNSPAARSEWSWSGFRQLSELRRSRWDEFRLVSALEPPLFLSCATKRESQIDYIEPAEAVSFLANEDLGSCPEVRLVISFTSTTKPPFTPSLDRETISAFMSIFGVQWLEEHYPSAIMGSFSKTTNSNMSNFLSVSSTGPGALYPITCVTSYNADEDQTRGFIISDIGAFDHFAFLGVPSQIEEYQHPLLIQVLVTERSLEALMYDLEYVNTRTAAESSVTLNNQYADKVASYRVFWCNWQTRLLLTRSSVEHILSQLEEIGEWLPSYRVNQYKASGIKIKSRLKYMEEHCKSAEKIGESISNRLSAWQDAAFRKTSKEDSEVTLHLTELTRKDGSTMKLLAFLGTIFLPATFVSSFFSMPIFNWEASSASGVLGDHFWVWWAMLIPLSLITFAITILWIKFKIGNENGFFQDKKTENHPQKKQSNDMV